MAAGASAPNGTGVSGSLSVSARLFPTGLCGYNVRSESAGARIRRKANGSKAESGSAKRKELQRILALKRREWWNLGDARFQ